MITIAIIVTVAFLSGYFSGRHIQKKAGNLPGTSIIIHKEEVSFVRALLQIINEQREFEILKSLVRTHYGSHEGLYKFFKLRGEK